MKHVLDRMRLFRTFGIYGCSCGSLGYGSVSPHLANRGSVEAAVRRNHAQHVKRKTL